MNHHAITATSLASLAAVAIAIACSKNKDATAPVNNVVKLKATLSASAENPGNASTGTGSFTATLDTVTNAFTYDLTFSGLTSSVSLGHIHGPAGTTANAGPIINFATLAGATFTTGATSGTAHGSTVLSAANQVTATINGDSLRKILLAGLTYANIHTTQNAGGEIRGQITKQ